MPIVRMRVTPASRACGDQLGLGRRPAVEVGVAVDHGRVLASGTAARASRPRCRRAPRRSCAPASAVVRRAERGEQLARRSPGCRACSSTVDDAQALGERAQRGVELAGLRLVLGELPRRALLDVAVEPPHALPDALERLRDLRAVEQRRDLVAQALEVLAERGVDVDARARRRRGSGRSSPSCGWRGCRARWRARSRSARRSLAVETPPSWPKETSRKQ